MKYFVSRQRYFGVEEDEACIVEVCIGGLDYANADMLGVKWASLGEGKEFTDPREAVEAAIAVCEQWKHSEPTAKVGMGATMGFTQPFEGEEYETLRENAEKMYERLPKCMECGSLLGKETYTHDLVMDDERFCREYCAEKNHDNQLEQMLPDDEEVEDES